MYVKYKNEQKFAGKDTEYSDDIEAFDDCGYVLDGTELVVDIDHLPKESIRALINIFDIKTQVVWTDRGAHLYFKKPKGHRRASGITPLCFDIEYKYKPGESITIKRFGQKREIENEGVRQDLPFCLTVGRGSKYQNLVGWGDGAGRNKALHRHKRTLATLPEYKKYLDFINRFVFDTPLKENEFAVVAREEEFTGGKDEECLTAEAICRRHKVVKYRGTLYYYDDDEYKSNLDELNRLAYTYCPDVKTRYIDEVIKQMDYKCELVPDDKVFEVKFNNGILFKGDFIECDFTEFTPFTINVEYDPNAEPVKEVDDYLDLLTDGDENYRQLICEILGHILVTDKEMKRLLAKFFIFVGDGGNGKGTLLQVIKSIVNINNCSALSIQNMTDERYFNQMFGKLVNLGDDIENNPLNEKQLKILKNLSSADPVELRKLYSNSETVELVISLIFTSNHILKSFEKGEAFKRRIIWLPMYNKPTSKDKHFISKLTTPKALQYWVRLAVEGYFRLYENDAFTESDKVNEFNLEYHFDNDSTIVFLQDITDKEIENHKPKEIYDEYCIWVEENLTDKPLSAKTLKQNIESLRGFVCKPKNIDGRTKRVYVKNDR